MFGNYISFSREVTIVTGYLTTIAIAIGVYSVCLNIIIKENFLNGLSRREASIAVHTVQIACLSFVVLNTEIWVHASSNMPYELPMLCVVTPLLILTSTLKQNGSGAGGDKYWRVDINLKDTVGILSILAITLAPGFQSIFVVLPFALAMWVRKGQIDTPVGINREADIACDEKGPRMKLKVHETITMKVLKGATKVLVLSASCLLLYFWLRKLSVMIGSGNLPGEWSLGIDGVYNLDLRENSLADFARKLPFNISKVVGQSLYAGQPFQDITSIVCSILFAFALCYLGTTASRPVALFTLILFIELVVLAAVGNIGFTPTRHLIFIYPVVWVTMISGYFLVCRKTSKNLQKTLITTTVLVLVALKVQIFMGSYSDINYSLKENQKAYSLAEKAEFYPWMANKYPNGKLDANSEFAYHSTQAYNILRPKNCEKVQKNQSYTLFLYSHNFALDNNMTDVLKSIAEQCGSTSFRYKIEEKVELMDRLGLEQDNRVYNGGSGLFAYLVRITPK
jgi:hypothetical protein